MKLFKSLVAGLVLGHSLLAVAQPNVTAKRSARQVFRAGVDYAHQHHLNPAKFTKPYQNITPSLIAQQAIRQHSLQQPSTLDLSSFESEVEAFKRNFDRHAQQFFSDFEDHHRAHSQAPGGSPSQHDQLCGQGDCEDQSEVAPSKSTDALPALASVLQAGQSSAQGGAYIFAGKVLHCRQNVLHSIDCCHFNGWAQVAGHCNYQEQALKRAHDLHRVIKVGRFCQKKIAGKCVQRISAYCVFGSRLATLVQRWGRGAQLGMDFGSAKHPNCQGITPSMLQAIDLDAVHFDKLQADYDQAISKPIHTPDVQGGR